MGRTPGTVARPAPPRADRAEGVPDGVSATPSLQWTTVRTPLQRATDDPTGTDPMPTPNELYDLAVDLRDQGDKAGAVAKLEEAVALDPSYAIGHGMLA